MTGLSMALLVRVSGLALALMVGSAAAEPAPGVLSFAGVRDSSVPQSDFDNGIVNFTQEAMVSDNRVASSSLSTGNSRAQSLLGTNRVEVINLARVDNEELRQNSIGGPFSAAVSAWFDTFTVTGGSGAAAATISSSITGRFGDGFGATGMYRLWKISPDDLNSLLAAPLDALLDDTLPQGLLSLDQSVIDTSRFTESGELLAPGSDFGRTLVGEVDFVYGETFILLSVMAGFANDFGSLSSFNSAVFGITAPTASTLQSGSGFGYAAAVPEPMAAWLMAIGLPLLALALRRRVRPATALRQCRNGRW
jgi:hypothetical protein